MQQQSRFAARKTPRKCVLVRRLSCIKLIDTGLTRRCGRHDISGSEARPPNPGPRVEGALGNQRPRHIDIRERSVDLVLLRPITWIGIFELHRFQLAANEPRRNRIAARP